MIRKPYPPGVKGKRRRSPPSEYAKQLREKQKLKLLYNLKERQFKNYVKEILSKKGKVEDASGALIKILESRLDNVVFRLGFATSRSQAKQLVSHGHFLVNKKSIDVPSYQLKKGDIISIKSSKITPSYSIGGGQNLHTLKKHKPPSWLELNTEKLEGKVIKEPEIEEVAPPVEISTIFEFYSR